MIWYKFRKFIKFLHEWIHTVSILQRMGARWNFHVFEKPPFAYFSNTYFGWKTAPYFFDALYKRTFYLQSWLQWGPYMLANSIIAGTKYLCNVESNTDHLCLQFPSTGTKYACNNGNRPRRTWLWFLDESILNVCNHIWSLLEKIASIYGSFWNWYCRDIWSSFL